jgi:hypothetical protein
MAVIPHPLCLSVFPIQDETIEVFAAEPQAVLNTLTEHVFQDAFKDWQKLRERYICTEGASSVMVASRFKVSFDQMAVPVPEIMDGSLISVCIHRVAATTSVV